MLQFNLKRFTEPGLPVGFPADQLWTVLLEVQVEQLKADLKEMPYDQFLGTAYWILVAGTVKAKAGMRCQLCNTSKSLQAHHRTYENHGEEHLNLGDLTCLCDKCHRKAHDIGKKKKAPKQPREKRLPRGTGYDRLIENFAHKSGATEDYLRKLTKPQFLKIRQQFNRNKEARLRSTWSL